MSSDQSAGTPTLFKSAKAFETWLKQHHATSPGLWLRIAKRNADKTSVTYLEAVEIALCWGWIDSQKKGLDEQYFLQRFTPRRARSLWSNQCRQGYDAAQGGPHAGTGPRASRGRKGRRPMGPCVRRRATSEIPEDLLAALDVAPAAKAFFSTINATNRYAVLWRIQTAVKAETRARRIAQLVEMLARKETMHIVKPKD